MSINYRIDEDRGVAFVLWDHVVTADEWLSHVRRLVADPMWPPLRGLHLSDLRSARIDRSINAAVLEEASALFGSDTRISTLKAAIVAGDAYAQSRVFEDFIAQHRAIVIAFNTLRPACEWLGIDTEDAQRELEALRTSARESA
jgi:hypothetical protein